MTGRIGEQRLRSRVRQRSAVREPRTRPCQWAVPADDTLEPAAGRRYSARRVTRRTAAWTPVLTPAMAETAVEAGEAFHSS